MEILGFAISGLVAFIFLLVGIVGLLGKKGLGNSVRGFLGMIPIGSPKLWSAIILIIGLVAGGFTYGYSQVTALAGTASFASTSADDVAVGDLQLANCRIGTYGWGPGIGGTSNVTFRTDPSDNTHLFADIKNSSGMGDLIINGTITCDRVTNNIRDGQQTQCVGKSDSYRNSVSTTDANVYYAVKTSTEKSQVPGYTWAQAIYLNDGSLATTSSKKEVTPWAFSQDVVSDTLGFAFQLQGDTALNYLNAQDSNDVSIVCGGDKVLTVTVTKIST